MQYTNHYILIKILQRFFECCALIFNLNAFWSHPGTCTIAIYKSALQGESTHLAP